jgi:hypothetical protein
MGIHETKKTLHSGSTTSCVGPDQPHLPPRDSEFPLLARLADLIIKATAMTCLAILPLCFYSYGSTPDRYLLNPISSILYYLLVAIALLLFASLRFGALYRISVAVTLGLTIGGMYSIELLLTMSGQTFDPRMATAAQLGVPFDSRDKLDVIAATERRNHDVVPNVNPSNFLRTSTNGSRRSEITLNGVETLPLGGVSNTLTVYCNESGQYVIYTSDEHGFNNPTGIWGAVPLTIAAVGDSFTQGSCVPADKNIFGVLRRQHPSTLNLGMVNDGPLTELATLKEYLPTLRPRIVLWFYYEGNDLEDLMNEGNTPLLRSYVAAPFRQGLLTEQRAIDDAVRTYIDNAKLDRQTDDRGVGYVVGNVKPFLRLELFRQRVALSSSGSHKEHPDVASHLGLFQQILLDAKAGVASWDGTLYVVYLPEWLRYAYPKAASTHRDAVLSIIRAAGIPLIDLHPIFQAQRDPMALFPFRINGHYNEAGYRLVGETVLSSIAMHNRKGLDSE